MLSEQQGRMTRGTIKDIYPSAVNADATLFLIRIPHLHSAMSLYDSSVHYDRLAGDVV